MSEDTDGISDAPVLRVADSFEEQLAAIKQFGEELRQDALRVFGRLDLLSGMVVQLSVLHDADTVDACRQGYEHACESVRSKLEDALQLVTPEASVSVTEVDFSEGDRPQGEELAALLKTNLLDISDAIGVRAYNALVRSGRQYVRELVALTPQELDDLPGVGPSTVDRVQVALLDIGLALKQPVAATNPG